jgi:hypothetical protein
MKETNFGNKTITKEKRKTKQKKCEKATNSPSFQKGETTFPIFLRCNTEKKTMHVLHSLGWISRKTGGCHPQTMLLATAQRTKQARAAAGQTAQATHTFLTNCKLQLTKECQRKMKQKGKKKKKYPHVII